MKTCANSCGRPAALRDPDGLCRWCRTADDRDRAEACERIRRTEPDPRPDPPLEEDAEFFRGTLLW